MKDNSLFYPRYVRISGFYNKKLYRISAWLLTIFFAFSITTLFVGKVNVVAVTEARIVSIEKSREIQSALDTRITQSSVKLLQEVKAGDILFIVDTKPIETELKKQQFLKAEISRKIRRLEALRSQFVHIAQSPLKKDLFDNPFKNSDEEFDQLLISMYRSLRDRISGLREQYQSITRQSTGLEERDSQLRLALTSSENRLISVQALVEKGFVARSEVMKEEENLRRFRSDQIELQSRRKQLDNELQNIVANIQSAVSEAMQKIDEDLNERRFEMQQINETISKLEYDYTQGKLISPIDGLVQEISVGGTGAIVRAGDVLAKITPNDHRAIEIEALISTKDIGFIYPRQPAIIKLDAYPFEKYGTIKGIVDKISSDSTFYEKQQGWYYKALIRPLEFEISVDGKKMPLHIGETGQVDIILRKRRLIDYFLEPVFRYTYQSFEKR